MDEEERNKKQKKAIEGMKQVNDLFTKFISQEYTTDPDEKSVMYIGNTAIDISTDPSTNLGVIATISPFDGTKMVMTITQHSKYYMGVTFNISQLELLTDFFQSKLREMRSHAASANTGS